MSSITIDNNELKALLKQALVELLAEKNQIVYDAIAEAVEEVGMIKAIQEGQASGIVDKERVFEALEREG